MQTKKKQKQRNIQTFTHNTHNYLFIISSVLSVLKTNGKKTTKKHNTPVMAQHVSKTSLRQQQHTKCVYYKMDVSCVSLNYCYASSRTAEAAAAS